MEDYLNHLNILQHFMIPSVRVIYTKSEIIYLVEDKNTTHKAKILQSWLKKRTDIIRIEWPALSA